MQPTRITSHPTANEQLLYFTSTSLTCDDQNLVFISDRTGHPNLFGRHLPTGRERQLTDNAEGFLKSYVYFDGRPYRGLAKASVSLDPERGIVYYLQGREIRCVDLQGRMRVLGQYPDGQMTGFTHVSADGRRLCVPTVDAQALDEDEKWAKLPGRGIDARIQAEGLCSYLRVYDTATGGEIACEVVPKAWITHVQFSPTDPDLILYNHEWCSDSGIRRMWMWDGRQRRHLRLREEGPGRSRLDWTCHEMWERDGQSIIYHGGYHNGPSYIGRVRPDGSEMIEIPLDASYKQYGHFTVGRPGALVSDGCYLETEEDKGGWGGRWISVQHVDWQARAIRWQPLCRHGSNWDCQCSHPHPIFNHAADAVFFTSNVGGARAVWSVRVPGGGES